MRLKCLAFLAAFLPVASAASVLRVPTAGGSACPVVALTSALAGSPATLAIPLTAAALPASALAAAPAPSPVPAAAASAHPYAAERLQSTFAELDRGFQPPAGGPVAEVRRRLRAELLSSALEITETSEPETLELVAREGDKALAAIQRRLNSGEIDPALGVRVDPDAAAVEAPHRPVKIGVYPVAADPFQWGHLLIALRAVGEQGLDRIVFVLAADDPNKPAMTPAAVRHPMGRKVLALFAPFFVYSPIALGTSHDGETNIFRLMGLNPGVPISAWYLVGDDHYRLVHVKGGPDTLPKLEANMGKDLGHDPSLHEIKVVFIRRERPEQKVPTTIEVSFLDHVGFEASSTLARKGRHDLVPYTALRIARERGLYGWGGAEPK